MERKGTIKRVLNNKELEKLRTNVKRLIEKAGRTVDESKFSAADENLLLKNYIMYSEHLQIPTVGTSVTLEDFKLPVVKRKRN